MKHSSEPKKVKPDYARLTIHQLKVLAENGDEVAKKILKNLRKERREAYKTKDDEYVY